MRLLFVQYAGDYRESVQRFARGEGETYYAQKYSVDTVAEIGNRIEEVAVICCVTDEFYNEVLPNGVRAIGAGFSTNIKISKLIRLIEEQNPTHLIIRAPFQEVFSWAIKNKVPTIATFAQAILTRGLRSRLWNYWLANLLNNDQIEWVGNYGVNACLSLQKIGVNPDKIIPWDFQATETPDDFSPKHLPMDKEAWELFYIGSLIELKGVGDILESLAQLRSRNFPVKLRIAGKDKDDFYHKKAKQLKIENDVEFLGLVPNEQVVPLMRESDIVLVPSRHKYPEGFPLAISHTFCSRTPLIASDHPMFIKSLKHGVNSMIFRAGNSTALATCVEKLLSDPDLYFNLSVASGEAWEKLQMPVKWAELINRWIDNSPENQEWLFAHRLSSRLYDSTFV